MFCSKVMMMMVMMMRKRRAVPYLSGYLCLEISSSNKKRFTSDC